jgi:tetratricopeptide (TPR) repeat protein
MLLLFCLAVGPAFAGVLAALLRRREDRQALRTAFAPRLLLGLIDHPRWIHGSVLAGSLAAAMLARAPAWGTACAGGAGLFLGATVYLLRGLRDRRLRRWLSTALVAAGIALAWAWPRLELPTPAASGFAASLGLLLVSLVYYLLTFAGQSEESEYDVAVVCLGVCLSLAALDAPRTVRSLIVLLPATLYVFYCERVRRRLVVFKHAIRGMEHERAGRSREALIHYRLATQVDPKSAIASAGVWRVHRKLDLSNAAGDRDLWEMIDAGVCLDRARALAKKIDDPAAGEEALKLLDVAELREPGRRFEAAHARVQTLLGLRRVEEAQAAARLAAAQTPADPADADDREAAALFHVWAGLMSDPALTAVGAEMTAEAKGAFDFLAVLEDRRRRATKDELADSFRPFVYRKLRLADVERLVEERSPRLEAIDWRYVRDVARDVAAEGGADRAIELLRIAELGLPQERLSIWLELARLHESSADGAGGEWRRRIFREGRDRGLERLGEADRQAVFESARALAIEAEARKDDDAAIEAWELYSQSPKAGAATHRRLADLYSGKRDRLSAIRHVRKALEFQLDEKDKALWLAELDRLYREISPQEVQARSAEAASYFDAGYCLRRASKLFEERAPSEEILHYLDLAAAVGVEHVLDVNYLLGRLHLREGRNEDAAACFQAVADNRPKRFRDESQARAYFRACRALGELLVERLDRPAEAVGYLRTFKDHVDSGADTLYLLARAYEKTGQTAQARKWYDMVLVYPSHPRAEAAKAALARLAK